MQLTAQMQTQMLTMCQDMQHRHMESQAALLQAVQAMKPAANPPKTLLEKDPQFPQFSGRREDFLRWVLECLGNSERGAQTPR